MIHSETFFKHSDLHCKSSYNIKTFYYVWILGGDVRGQELDSAILRSPFQLGIIYDPVSTSPSIRCLSYDKKSTLLPLFMRLLHMKVTKKFEEPCVVLFTRTLRNATALSVGTPMAHANFFHWHLPHAIPPRCHLAHQCQPTSQGLTCALPLGCKMTA